MNIKIGILEDKEEDYNVIFNFIKKWAGSTSNTISVFWFKTIEDIQKEFLLNACDIFFSDIEIGSDKGLTGVDICVQLREQGYKGEIIFLTAYSEYVFKGYDVSALNYLLKPIQYVELEKCMKRFLVIHTEDFYCIYKQNDIIRIPYNDIICINKDGHDIIFQTGNGLYMERKSLNEIEKKLPSQFKRCHKSSIVNISHIKSLIGYEMHLSNNKFQTVGRTYLSAIRTELLRFVNG